jgi:enoyl-CoA hydratase/carnithine racemase
VTRVDKPMLRTDRRDPVLLCTIDRPEKRNALHPDLIRELSDTLKGVETDASLRVVVLTGAGNTFCSGLDLVHLCTLESHRAINYLRSFFDLYRRLYDLAQPVIAAINGPAIAGGFDLAAACDLRLCSPAARFAQTEVLLGLTQILYPIYKVIGLGRAKELALTGEVITAEEAHRIGLVNRVYAAEELLDQAMNLAAGLAAKPRDALRETKRLSREVIDMTTDVAIGRMFEAISDRLQSDEHRREVEKYVARLEQRRRA